MVVYSVRDFAIWNRGKHDKVAKIMDERNNYKYKCKCGHFVVIRPKAQKTLCTWCNHLVFKDSEKQKAYDEEISKREALLKFKKEMRKHLK